MLRSSEVHEIVAHMQAIARRQIEEARAAIELLSKTVELGKDAKTDPVIELLQQQYYNASMDTAEAITAARAILSRVYPAERVGKALEDLAAGGESAGTDDLATEEPRLKWETETDRLPDENPAAFAWRAYAAEAKAGKLHRGVIYDEDRALGAVVAAPAPIPDVRT
jgi:hypothetical protein